jgi:tetratricopeptide (TPR) repeat protein
MKTYDINDIARYAEGELPAEERQAFEQALAADNNLQQQLALYREVHASLQQHFTTDAQQDQLKGTLLDMRKEFFPAAAKPAKIVSINRTLRYAVGIAAIFIITLFIWQPWQPSLFARYAETNMVNPAERGNDTDTLLQQAAVAFNQKEFAKAARLLEPVVRQDSTNSFANFYYGVVLLQTQQPVKARDYFTNLFAGESVFKYEAAFYNALTYLKEDNKTACKEWLQKIPADAGNYKKAQTLLQKL